MKIKICGLKREEDVEHVNRWKPDYVGFVFAGEKRKIDYDTAKKLKSRLLPELQVVGVFVNEKHEFICRLVKDDIIHIVQLHGDEDADYIQQLKVELQANAKKDIPIVKAVRVKNTKQVLEAEQLPVDYLLLDAFKDGEYGGSGKVFNHELIPHLNKPYFLAGGIDCKNVMEIIGKIRIKNVSMPLCVDVSSAVEVNGNKDGELIQEMISLVKGL